MRITPLALLSLLTLVACSEPQKDLAAPKPGSLAAPASPATAPPVADATKIYMSAGCAACHGPKGEGAMLGPTLNGLSPHWDREDLARFFADPESFVASVPRIAEQKAKYAMPMPPTPHLSEEDRLALADWLLQR